MLAPDNRAFERTLAGRGLTAADLLSEGNRDLTPEILLYHVIDGELRSGDVRGAAGSAVETLQGEAVDVGVRLRHGRTFPNFRKPSLVTPR
ncbi:MAG: fasciclin domain-containing protein, partial [Myxococcales bacterium]|nr:fasciclin domain-containing protein [Myxococcales bacterium]